MRTMSVKEFNDSLCIVYEVLPRRIDNLWKLVARKSEDFQIIIKRETDAINLMEEKIAEAKRELSLLLKKPSVKRMELKCVLLPRKKKRKSWICSMEMPAAETLMIAVIDTKERGKLQIEKLERIWMIFVQSAELPDMTMA